MKKRNMLGDNILIEVISTKKGHKKRKNNMTIKEYKELLEKKHKGWRHQAFDIGYSQFNKKI